MTSRKCVGQSSVDTDKHGRHQQYSYLQQYWSFTADNGFDLLPVCIWIDFVFCFKKRNPILPQCMYIKSIEKGCRE